MVLPMHRTLLVAYDVDTTEVGPVYFKGLNRTSHNWKVEKSVASSMMLFLFEYARVVRDLYSSSENLSIYTQTSLENPLQGWNQSYRSMQAHMREINSKLPTTSSTDLVPSSSEALVKFLSRSVELLSSRTESTTEKAKGIDTRLVLCLSPPKIEFDDSWTYIDANNVSLSIQDHVENLVLENNHKASNDFTRHVINKLELCILVFVPESPVEPVQQPITSDKKSPSPNKMDETPTEFQSEPKTDDKVESSSTPTSSTSPTSKATIYYQSPSCFSDGTQLPPSKIVSIGLKFVSADLNFVRPSFSHQIAIDLVSSHYDLTTLEIHGLQINTVHHGSNDIRTTNVSLITSRASNMHPLILKVPQRVHIGHQLGAGTSKIKNLFWKPWDPSISIHSLPCKEIARITPTHPHLVSSMTLIDYLLGGKPVLLSSRLTLVEFADEAPVSVILMRHGNYIFCHTMKEYDDVALADLSKFKFESLLNTPELIARHYAMKNLLEANTFTWSQYGSSYETGSVGTKYNRTKMLTESVPLGPRGASIDLSKRPSSANAILDNGTTYMTTRGLDCWTRIFPLFEQDSLCFLSTPTETLQRIIMPILITLTRLDLASSALPAAKEQIQHLLRLSELDDPQPFENILPKGAAASKRREIYNRLWTELLIIAREYQNLSDLHRELANYLRISVKDQALAASIFGEMRTPSNAMDIDIPSAKKEPSEMPTPSFQTEKDAEANWLNDISNVRHDIVGLQDLSWAGGTLEVKATPTVASRYPPSSLYHQYWEAASRSKKSPF